MSRQRIRQVNPVWLSTLILQLDVNAVGLISLRHDKLVVSNLFDFIFREIKYIGIDLSVKVSSLRCSERINSLLDLAHDCM